MRLVDIDDIGVIPIDITDIPYDECLMVYLQEDIDNAPPVKVIPIEVVELISEKICDLQNCYVLPDMVNSELDEIIDIIDEALKEQNT